MCAAQRLDGNLRVAVAVIVRDAAAEAHSGELREVRDQFAELERKPREIFVQLLKFRPAADVRVQHRDAHPRGECGVLHRDQVTMPDAVLRGRPAGVAGVHMAVTEAGIHADAHGPR